MAPPAKSNLFLACTPLQIINAIEARDRFHTNDRNFLVMVHSPRSYTQQRKHLFQVTDDLIDESWEDVWNLKLSKFSQLVFPLTARGIRRRLGPCANIYSGGLQTQQCHLINSVPHDRLIMLDGGACIHSIPQLLKSGSRRRRLHSLIPGMRPRLAPNTTASYFTSYDVNVSNSEVIRNDYRVLRNRLQKSLPQRDEIVFISQPLEHDLKVNINHQVVIETAMRYHGVTEYRRILHPREKHQPERSERLPYLIELFGLREGYLPKAFVTYMSSAARSLQLIHGLPVTCFDMRPELPSGTDQLTRIELDKLYADFQRSGITVLELPEEARSLSRTFRPQEGDVAVAA